MKLQGWRETHHLSAECRAWWQGGITASAGAGWEPQAQPGIRKDQLANQFRQSFQKRQSRAQGPERSLESGGGPSSPSL